MMETLKLFLPGLFAFRHSLSLNTAIRKIPITIVAVSFGYLIYLAVYESIEFLTSMEEMGVVISFKLLSLLLLTIGGLLVISNIITSVSIFYQSSDLQLLRTKPIEINSIINYKTMQNIITSSWMSTSILLPVLAGYGVYFKGGLGYYLSTGLLLPFLIAIPSAIGIAIGHLMRRVFSASSIRYGLGLFMLMSLITTYAAVFGRPKFDLSSPEGIIDAIVALDSDRPLLPSFWMTQTISDSLSAHTAQPIYGVMIILTALTLSMASGLVGRLLYEKNLDNSGNMAANRPVGTDDFAYLLRPFPVMWKDIKTFLRDPAQYSQIYIILTILVIYIYNFKALPLNMLTKFSPLIREILFTVNLCLSGLVMTTMAARFIFPAISLEGISIWIIRSSPYPIGRFLLEKLLPGIIPTGLTVLLLSVSAGYFMKLDPALTLSTVVFAAQFVLSIGLMAIGIACRYPDYRHKSAAELSVSTASLIFIFISFALVAATSAICGYFIYEFRHAILTGCSDYTKERYQLYAAYACATVINVIAASISYKTGRKALDRDLL